MSNDIKTKAHFGLIWTNRTYFGDYMDLNFGERENFGALFTCFLAAISSAAYSFFVQQNRQLFLNISIGFLMLSLYFMAQIISFFSRMIRASKDAMNIMVDLRDLEIGQDYQIDSDLFKNIRLRRVM